VALWETSDAGATWSAVTRVPSAKGPGPIALPDQCAPATTAWSTASTGWIFGTCLTSDPQPEIGDTVLLVTHDGGRDWQPQTLPIPPSVTLSFLGPPTFTTPDHGEMVGFTTSGTPCVYATKDGGATWSPQCGALPAPENSHPGAVMAPDGTAVTLLEDGSIAESTHGGRSWQTPGPPHPSWRARPRPWSSISWTRSTVSSACRRARCTRHRMGDGRCASCTGVLTRPSPSRAPRRPAHPSPPLCRAPLSPLRPGRSSWWCPAVGAST